MKIKKVTPELTDILYDLLWEKVLGGNIAAALVRIILGLPLVAISIIFWIAVVAFILN